MKKIIIFDMDGTLIDSKKDITISINHVRKINHNLEPLDESFVVKAINLHERNLPYLFYGTKTYEKRDRVIFEKHYKKQCIEHSKLYDGVKEMLFELKEMGVLLSVATNASTVFSITMLEHLKVAQLFDMVVGADKVEKSKPDPQMLEMILKYYDFDRTKDKAWMVGDNSKDMLSGELAGIKSVFVTWGFSDITEYKNTISKPQEIKKLV